VLERRSSQTRDKPLIGIACVNYNSDNDSWLRDIAHGDYTVPTGFPNNRYYTATDYAGIFQLCKLAGYDVITLDTGFGSIADRVELLTNFCDCVIGYEGGMAHLCHSLHIPYIMLPWHSTLQGTVPVYPEFFQILHLDRRTYFLESIDEILSWTPAQLEHAIDQCYAEQGNNVFYTDKHAGPGYVLTDGSVFQTASGFEIRTQWSALEKFIFSIHIEKFNFCGAPLTMVNTLPRPPWHLNDPGSQFAYWTPDGQILTRN
jgi:hypothetical protein